MIDQKVRDEMFDLHFRVLCEAPEELRQLILDANKNISPEAMALHKDSLVISMADGWCEGYGWEVRDSGLTCTGMTTPDFTSDTGMAMRYMADAVSVVNNDPEHMMLIEKPDDILKAKKEGKFGIIMHAQNCEFVHHLDIDAMVSLFQKAGLRVMTIAYNHRSFAAEGCHTGVDGHLTKEGKILVRAMQKYGITVDLAHVGRRSSLEAMDLAEKPMIFSHANPEGYCKGQGGRNISDEMAKRCAETGGAIGVCTYPDQFYDGSHFPTIEDYINAIDYYVNLVGIDHVAIGLDHTMTLGAYERRRTFGYANFTDFDESSYTYQSYLAGRGYLIETLEGLINIANCPNITDRLLKRGYKEADIRKILGENWLRVFRDTWVY